MTNEQFQLIMIIAIPTLFGLISIVVVMYSHLSWITRRTNEIEGRLPWGIESRFTGIEARLTSMEKRINTIEAKNFEK